MDRGILEPFQNKIPWLEISVGEPCLLESLEGLKTKLSNIDEFTFLKGLSGFIFQSQILTQVYIPSLIQVHIFLWDAPERLDELSAEPWDAIN